MLEEKDTAIAELSKTLETKNMENMGNRWLEEEIETYEKEIEDLRKENENLKKKMSRS